jgi:uncharacterized protein YecT (DUF1311 family)
MFNRQSSVHTLVIAVMLSATRIVLAEDPIDIELGNCIEKDYRTSGMTDCQYRALGRWESKMNTVLQVAKSKLTANEYKSLQISQQSWVKFKESEYTLIDKVYSNLQGTMYIPLRVSDRTEVVKSRVQWLEHLIYLRSDN